ncbi:hypothetical protein RHGRI_015365 [Rhododendron griersonianum]|uniref:laccase n=1 Tax=Rhododendron griersonianum TaxID=479676 RepID=A0AAV6KD33_9ERIC|nr:hypothetical protein RHGRI_015365 [Rhododendron griersonianum]
MASPMLLLAFALVLLAYSSVTSAEIVEHSFHVREWWNANIMDIENQALGDGHGPNTSDAFTINGQPGDLYNCSSFGTYKLKVVQGKTHLLRIINVALYSELFFTIANHTMTVVAVDACYTNPMVTDVVVISPGQTIDVLLTADQPLASYYMAAHCYDSLGEA